MILWRLREGLKKETGSGKPVLKQTNKQTWKQTNTSRSEFAILFFTQEKSLENKSYNNVNIFSQNQIFKSHIHFFISSYLDHIL